MKDAFICDGIRTPIGRYGGGLSSVRTDDLAAIPLKELLERNPNLQADKIDDVIMGCANQAGEDNRNVARMATLLAKYPIDVPATTINRLCGSGMDAVIQSSRAIQSSQASMMVAGGVESMSRAPFVLAKGATAFSRNAEIYDTTIGWRFINKKFQEIYGTYSMPETAENVAKDYNISREDQDQFAANSQNKYQAALADGFYRGEIVPVNFTVSKKGEVVIDQDEHPRSDTTRETLGKLKALFGDSSTITAGNASGINDGSCALLLANEEEIKANNLTPRARVLGGLSVGVEPRIMGIGPAVAGEKILQKYNLTFEDLDVIELNEAFASQGLATLRQWGLTDEDERVNPNGGAIALGHPLGMSGARLVLTALRQLERVKGKYALCTMCIGVGQGITVLIERI